MKTDKNTHLTPAGHPIQTEQTSTNTNGPCIYVACLAAYNNGKLHGKWINANQEAEALWKEIADMLKQSPDPCAEEWAIHDYEGFGDYHVSESEDIEEVAAIATQIIKQGEPYLAALALSSNRAEADALMEDYCGRYDSNGDFAQQLLEDLDMLPKDLPAWIHIDWESTAREIMMDYTNHNGHYFRCC